MDIIDDHLDNSDEKHVDVEMLNKELVTAQALAIVEDDDPLSPDGSESIPQVLLDNEDEEITYQIRSGVNYRVVSVDGDDLTDGLQQIVGTNGQLYVIGSPEEVFAQQNQRNIVPRVTQNMNLQMENARGTSSSPQCRPRDDRRRATHNEVERRRRDKINNWIMKLSKIIPECSQDTGKGSFETQSKGGILAKACDYIVELRSSNQRLMEFGKENEQLTLDLDTMAHQLEELRNENEQLRTQLIEHGIHPHVKSLNIT